MYTVRSGFAIEFASEVLRDSILLIGESFEAKKAKIKPASEWFSMVVSEVPLYLRTLDGRVLETNELVANECLAVSGAALELVRPNKAQLDSSMRVELRFLVTDQIVKQWAFR